MSAFKAFDPAAVTSDERVLRAVVAAYLGRYRGQSRLHTGSDLKIYLTWCTDQDLDPLLVGRVDIERYVRWLQEIRYYQPSTVSRLLSVVVGFYRVCVIDQILPYSPADYVRRPPVPAQSPPLRLRQLAATAGIRMPRMHPHMLRHTFVTTMLDAGVSLRDVQIAARHADPRTTMRYDGARKNLDRHPNYILAAYMASGT